MADGVNIQAGMTNAVYVPPAPPNAQPVAAVTLLDGLYKQVGVFPEDPHVSYPNNAVSTYGEYKSLSVSVCCLMDTPDLSVSLMDGEYLGLGVLLDPNIEQPVNSVTLTVGEYSN